MPEEPITLDEAVEILVPIARHAANPLARVEAIRALLDLRAHADRQALAKLITKSPPPVPKAGGVTKH